MVTKKRGSGFEVVVNGAWVPTRRERGMTRIVDFIESESVSLT